MPRAAASTQRPVKICQCRGPGESRVAFGWERRTSQKAIACDSGVGCVKTFGCVTIRRNPLRTSSAIPYGCSAATTPSSQER